MQHPRIKRGVYAIGLAVLIVTAAIGIASSAGVVSGEPRGPIQTFEYTVWRDTLKGGDNNGRLIPISEREATRASLLVLRNEKAMLPFQQLGARRFHLLTLGKPLETFSLGLNQYAPVTRQAASSLQGLRPDAFAGYWPLIVALNQPHIEPEDLQIFLDAVSQYTEVVLINFGPSHYLEGLVHLPTVVLAPPARRMSQEMTAQLLFGGISAVRPIPEQLAEELNLERSFPIQRVRLGYADPEYVGISSDSLVKIEHIIREGIEQFAMPGCQVLVAKDGYVIYDRAFGYHTYERRHPVRKRDLYDIASVTKVAATTLASMKLVDEGRLDLVSPLDTYFQDDLYTPVRKMLLDTLKLSPPSLSDSLMADLPIRISRDTLYMGDSIYLVSKRIRERGEPRKSNVFSLSASDLLTHHSGLPAGLPIGMYFQKLNSPLYSPVADNGYSVPVASKFYLHERYLDSLWNETKSLQPDSGRYVYSCVNMVLMQRTIDSLNQGRMDEYLDTTFYKALGMQTMGFNPQGRIPAHRLVPTSQDGWRGQTLCGTVHDPTAALLGGVSGNAGLFSNASDLAIFGQLLLNDGTYGGEEFLSEEVVNQFTQRRRGHRGLGFDMPPSNSDYIVAPSAPASTYGHTGFTGTCFWVDPENGLVFIFLSNRIHPSPNNQRINQLRIRQRVHQVIYDAMGIEPRFQEEIPEPTQPTLPSDLIAIRDQKSQAVLAP